MISLALAAVLAAQNTAGHVVLSRGAVVNGIPIWDVEDATLDATKPTENSEGDSYLAGGPLRTILIRFGDLSRIIHANQHVRSAALVFTIGQGDAPKLQSISRMLVPWGDGPYRTLGGFDLPHIAKPGEDAKVEEPSAPRGSSTWRDRRSGIRGGNWNQVGARGAQDAAPIDGAAFQTTGTIARIDGLARAVQTMADHPYANYGFAIVMDNQAGFPSSEADVGRPRLDIVLEDQPEAKGPDLSVTSIARTGPDGKLPADGQEATFTATIKNVGDAAATGFTTTWTVDERPGSAEPHANALAPGEQTTVQYHLAYRPDRSDHRFQTIGVEIHSDGDVNPRNDELTVPIAGKAVSIVIWPNMAADIAKSLNARGSHSPEDWAVDQVQAFNDVYLARSRFSFAPEGAKERIAVQNVVVGDPTVGAAQPRDGSELTGLTTAPGRVAAPDAGFLQNLGVAIGLADRSASCVPAANNPLAPDGGLDRYPGLMGYGDTRFEGLAPGQIELPYEAYNAPIFEAPVLEADGLLAATDVLRINAGLLGPPANLPKTILIRAKTQSNMPLAGLKMDFFRLKDGKIAKDAVPAFSVTTDLTGNVLLPTDNGPVFGAADPKPGNDALFVRATSNGVTAGTWLKAWQVIDTSARGGIATHAIVIMDLHFNLPMAELDPGTNLATDRIITDSAGSLPAKLSALIDGSNETEATVGSKAGDWLEIDLGRDRTIGEVDLIGAPGAFWNKFDLVVYATGQKPDEALLWSKEVDGAWTAANRSDAISANRVSVPYRGASIRVRYLRFISKVDSPGKLAEIKIVPIKNP